MNKNTPVVKSLRKQAAEALRDYRKMPVYPAYDRGIKWGLYLGYKWSATRVLCPIVNPDEQ